jgi:hypothetical protein
MPAPYLTTNLYRRFDPPLPVVRIVGLHDYFAIVARYADEPPLLIAARLVAAFPCDFGQAESAVCAPVWRYLSSTSTYSLHPMVDPGFSARDALLKNAGVTALPPGAAMQGVDVDLRARTSEVLRETDDDVAKAIWATLAAYQLLCSTLDIEPEDPWWSPAWLSEYLPRVARWRTRREHSVRAPAPPSEEDDVDF